ncbi:hypothetical protein L2U69_05555 [Zavarzinia compransoris]|uniref:hypothetical protein n=1 Tax=Zavarzinia marina TaxID=2911065 RepID=UPI001F44E433|nr:hypothetical protein [Zavarzinia marina]MCF4165100.1 hypothetical protein [Zavarzinia marina]
MKMNAFLSSAALASVIAATSFVSAQEAMPVSDDQFGYGKAVAETNFQLSIFGGGDENGGLYGGAPSLTIPLGDSVGLQIDGIAGFVADEVGFAGGAAQLFARDPESYLIGVVGAGYYLEGYSQYAVSGISEFYIDNITLEATVGYTMGEVVPDEFYGRGGIAIYPNPNLRLGGGLVYSDEVGLGGDIQLETLLTDIPGMALFATGAFDEAGATGYGGVRFYFGSGSSLLGADRTKQYGEEPSLMDIHRRLLRPNFFLSDPIGFGLRQISRAGGALNGGDPFGDLGDDPDGEDEVPCTDLICTVQDTLEGITDDTLLDPITDLVNTLVDPDDGALAALTDQLAMLTDEDGALGALTEVVQALAGTEDSALTPLTDALNTILQGLSGGTDPSDITDQIEQIPGLGGLLGGLLP